MEDKEDIEVFSGCILESSDWHLEPDELLPAYAQKFFALAAKDPTARVVLNGDIFDIIIHGVKPYLQSSAMRSFLYKLPSQGCDLLVGNHELNEKELRRLFASDPRVRIAKSLDLESEDGICWHFEHGDSYSVDWGRFHWLYDGVAAAGLRVCPKLWYRFCRQCGWVPSVYKPKVATCVQIMGNMPVTVRTGESQRYTELTGMIWNRALLYGQKNGCHMVLGHTHMAKKISNGFYVVDGGDMRDGSYVVIKDDVAEIRWLK